MIKRKEGVELTGLSEHMWVALHQVHCIFMQNDLESVTVTSTLDGEHKPGSLHYLGNAIDIRTRDIHADTIQRVYYVIKKILKQIDKRYQTVLHDTHLHIEYDRRINK
jgi:hypothetical protein